jgi:serine/threonine protein kinase
MRLSLSTQKVAVQRPFREPQCSHGMDRYTRMGKLGQGTYAIVYRALDNSNGETVALKMIKVTDEDGIPATVLREISILKSVSHPNILALRDVINEPTSLALVTDYMDIDLRRFLLQQQGRSLNSDLLCSYAFQLLSGLFVLQTHRIIHRDLKPENLLLNAEGLLKICDFGLSRYVTLPLRQYSSNVVTLWYRAPELMFGKRQYDMAIDIWSAGLIIAELVRGTALFPGDSDVDQLHRIFRVMGSPTAESLPNYDEFVEENLLLPEYSPVPLRDALDTADDQLIDLVGRMLIYDPKQRITSYDALKHPYFDRVSPKTREVCLPPSFE